MRLSKDYVERMKNYPGDYVESVEALAEEWLEMKKTLEWIEQNSKEEKVLKKVKKLNK